MSRWPGLVGGLVVAIALAVAVGTRITGPPDDGAPGPSRPSASPPTSPAASPAAPPPAPPPMEVPGDAVRLALGEDLAAAVEEHPPGTVFVVDAGVHRSQEIRPRDGDRFVGEPGAVLSGAAVLDPAAFRAEGRTWVIGEQRAEGETHGEFLDGHERETHPEDLYVDGRRLRHVDRRADVDDPHEWFFDYDRDEVVVAFDPATPERIELATAGAAFSGQGVRDVTIENLVVRHYASPSQRGAIDGRLTAGWTIRFVDASHNHSYGLGSGPGMLVEHSRFTHNGQAGVGGPGELHSDSPVAPGEIRPLQIRSSEIASNRELGYRWRWEGGGTKFSVTSGMVFANNLVRDNGGPGLWWDIDNADAIGCANLVEGNVLGIFAEIGQGATIAWNEVRDNVRMGEEDASAGIFVSNSSDVEIRGNAVGGQPDGILVRAAEEGEPSDRGPRRSTGLHVHDNAVAFDGLSGIRLETDEPEERETARFDGNRWLVPDVDAAHWLLGAEDEPLTWEDWRAAGMDLDGEVDDLSGAGPRLVDDAPAFTETHYGPLGDGDPVPERPPAATCDDSLR